VVERTLSWLGGYRRLSHEYLPAGSEAMITMVNLAGSPSQGRMKTRSPTLWCDLSKTPSSPSRYLKLEADASKRGQLKSHSVTRVYNLKE
jgi:hypothetical protein